MGRLEAVVMEVANNGQTYLRWGQAFLCQLIDLFLDILPGEFHPLNGT